MPFQKGHKGFKSASGKLKSGSPSATPQKASNKSSGVAAAAAAAKIETFLSPSLSPSTSVPSQQQPQPVGSQKKRHLSLIRSFSVADFITLANAICGTCSIFLCLNFLENHNGKTGDLQSTQYLYGAFVLLPLGLLADIMDGDIARRYGGSRYGADLDSLSDVISFSVAPAVLGFTLGLRGRWDCLILSFFVVCGVSRLARFNVTRLELSAGKDKVEYFEGFPVPMSLIIVFLWMYKYYQGNVFDDMWFGKHTVPFIGGHFHPFALIYFFFGCMNVSSTIRIPKP